MWEGTWWGMRRTGCGLATFSKRCRPWNHHLHFGSSKVCKLHIIVYSAYVKYRTFYQMQWLANSGVVGVEDMVGPLTCVGPKPELPPSAHAQVSDLPPSFLFCYLLAYAFYSFLEFSLTLQHVSPHHKAHCTDYHTFSSFIFYPSPFFIFFVFYISFFIQV